MEKRSVLDFKECGIANVLSQFSLYIPLNQRSYKWSEDRIQTLFEDITKAFKIGEKIYFLGMLVFTEGSSGLEVADGQQRLATITILIAAIRDYLKELNDNDTVSTYQNKYLLEYDPHSEDFKPKLSLNFDDRDFFYKNILKPIDKRGGFQGKRVSSHERLEAAMKIANDHVNTLVVMFANEKEKRKRLYDFVDYLHNNAQVIVFIVPGYVGNAFKMFETLNARGMRASQIDILKNYLFDLGKNKISDMQLRWTSMLSTIDELTDAQGEDELLVDFIRYYWIAHYGPITEPELGDKIQNNVLDERPAYDLVGALDSFATDFSALNMPREHPSLSKFSRDTRNCIYTITKELGIKQIMPLMLAILRYFNVKEAEKAFDLCLSWTVRFLIAGGGSGGLLDRYYGLRAKEISNQEILTANKLAQQMSSVVHNDRAFREAFEVASVRQIKFARYYLRAIDLYLAQDPHPQVLPNEDTLSVNAEHVLPVTPSPDWNVPSDIIASYSKRLGNIVLLRATDNVKVGNKAFTEKKKAYKISPFKTTQWVAEYKQWDFKDINHRQKRLAELAPKVWPIEI
jgi:hypothetical protein